MNTLDTLLAAARRLPTHRYTVDRPVDKRGQYQFQLPPEFPLEIRRICFPADQPNRPLTWHTYLEIFVLLSSECRRQMGSMLFRLSSGDVLVMDHLKLHAVADFPGDEAEAIVIRFQPDLVRSPGSAASDHLLLLPFYCHIKNQPHVVRADEPAAVAVHTALVRLIEYYATSDRSNYWQTGSRASFLFLLHHLASHFQAAERLKPQFARQTKLGRMERVFAYIADHYVEAISLPAMATKAGLGKSQFHAVFKDVAGMTLVDYVAQVRLTHAERLLRETDHSIAEIASEVGFSDQSYFDRRFRQRFGQTPVKFRRDTLTSARP